MPKRKIAEIKPICDWEQEVPVLMDIALLCRILGVGEMTVYKLEKQYGLPRTMVGGNVRYRKESVIQWLDSLERKMEQA